MVCVLCVWVANGQGWRRRARPVAFKGRGEVVVKMPRYDVVSLERQKHGLSSR
jgi:hypothetical protein